MSIWYTNVRCIMTISLSREGRQMKLSLLYCVKAVIDTICVLGGDMGNGCKSSNFIILCIQVDGQKTTRPFNLEIPTVLNTVALQWSQLSSFLKALISRLPRWHNSASAGWYSYFMFMAYKPDSKCSLVFFLYHGTLGLWVVPASWSE